MSFAFTSHARDLNVQLSIFCWYWHSMCQSGIWSIIKPSEFYAINIAPKP